MGLNIWEMFAERKKSNLANARAREDLELIARFNRWEITEGQYKILKDQLTAERALKDNPEKSLWDLALRVAWKGTVKAAGAILSLWWSWAKSVWKGIDNLLFRWRKNK